MLNKEVNNMEKITRTYIQDICKFQSVPYLFPLTGIADYYTIPIIITRVINKLSRHKHDISSINGWTSERTIQILEERIGYA